MEDLYELEEPQSMRAKIETDEPCYHFLTPPEIASILRVKPDKVLSWIHQGKLKAVNVGNGTSRPRYRVSKDNFDTFLKLREVPPPFPVQRRRRNATPPEGGPIDPKLGEELLKKGQAERVGNVYYRVWNGVILFF